MPGATRPPPDGRLADFSGLQGLKRGGLSLGIRPGPLEVSTSGSLAKGGGYPGAGLTGCRIEKASLRWLVSLVKKLINSFYDASRRSHRHNHRFAVHVLPSDGRYSRSSHDHPCSCRSGLGLLLRLPRCWTFRQKQSLWTDLCHVPSSPWPTGHGQRQKIVVANRRLEPNRRGCRHKVCYSFWSLSEKRPAKNWAQVKKSWLKKFSAYRLCLGAGEPALCGWRFSI